jgi:hypothetical protein
LLCAVFSNPADGFAVCGRVTENVAFGIGVAGVDYLRREPTWPFLS